MYYDSAGLMYEKGPKLTPDKCQIWVKVCFNDMAGNFIRNCKGIQGCRMVGWLSLV